MTLNFSTKYSKHTKWHLLDVRVAKLESNGTGDIKSLLENVHTEAHKTPLLLIVAATGKHEKIV